MYSREFIYEVRYAVTEKPTTRFAVPISCQLLANLRNAIRLREIAPTHIVAGSRFMEFVHQDPTLTSLMEPVDIEYAKLGFASTLLTLPVFCESLLPVEDRLLREDVVCLVALSPKDAATWSTPDPILDILDCISVTVSR